MRNLAMNANDSAGGGFSAEERAAIKQRAAELKSETTRGRKNKKATEELDVLNKIAGMEDHDRELAERIHAIVTQNAPDLAPKLWYGQPAYARGGKVVCFFRSGSDDKERYSTFGFTPQANLDAAAGVWATSFAIGSFTPEAEAMLADLVQKAVA